MDANKINLTYLITAIISFLLMLINVNTWIGLQNFAYYYGGRGFLKPIARFMEDLPFVITFPFKGATLIFILSSLLILSGLFLFSLKNKASSTNVQSFYTATGIFSAYILINTLVLMAYFH